MYEYRRAQIAKHVKAFAAKNTHLRFCNRVEYARNPSIGSCQTAYYLALDAQQRYDRASRNANMAACMALVNASRGLTDAHGCSAAAATTASSCSRAQKNMLDRFCKSMFQDTTYLRQSMILDTSRHQHIARLSEEDISRMSHWDDVLLHEQGQRALTFGPGPELESVKVNETVCCGVQSAESLDNAVAPSNKLLKSISTAFGKLQQAQEHAMEQVKLLQQVNATQSEADKVRMEQDEARKAADALRCMHDEARASNDKLRKRDDGLRHEKDYTRHSQDEIRDKSDEARTMQDAARSTADSKRSAQDESRLECDKARVLVDSDRGERDMDRVHQDVDRVHHDENRVTSDQSRVVADTKRLGRDNERAVIDVQRQVSDSTRANQDVARTKHDDAREMADEERNFRDVALAKKIDAPTFVSEQRTSAVDQAFASALDRLTGVCEQLVQQNKEITEKLTSASLAHKQNAEQINGLKHSGLLQLVNPAAKNCVTAVQDLERRDKTVLAEQLMQTVKTLDHLQGQK